MATISPTPKLQFLDLSGQPLVGGKLYSYQAGTTTPLATYTDSSATVSNPNPIILDARGEASVWLGATLYKFRLENSAGAEIWTVDNVGGAVELATLAQSNGSSLVGFIQAGNGAIARTAQDKMREIISVEDFGASPSASAATNTTAIQAAFDAVPNFGGIRFKAGGTYNVNNTITMSPTKIGVIIEGNGAVVNCQHNNDGFVFTSTNENFSRHKIYNLNVVGPNVSYPTNPAQLLGTSLGAAVKIGRNNPATANAGYLTAFINCSFRNFKYGVYLQNAILCSFYNNYITFNQYGIYIDSGATNANTFIGCGIRENRITGVYFSGITGGTLATQNFFYGCAIETNIPYDSSAGGYPSVFDPNTGYGLEVRNSYDNMFSSCYFENQNYSIVVSASSDGNSFLNCRFASGGAVNVRPGGVIIRDTGTVNNTFSNCHMVSTTTTLNTYTSTDASQVLNNILDSQGFTLDRAAQPVYPYISNMRKHGVAGNNYGAITMPPQGLVSNPVAGTTQGTITGIGTATATLNAFGIGEFILGSQINANTTITSIAGMRPGQILTVSNITVRSAGNLVTLGSATTYAAGFVLRNRQSTNFNILGQQIVFYCNGLGRVYEIGRNFSGIPGGIVNFGPGVATVDVVFATAGFPDEPDASYQVFTSIANASTVAAVGSLVPFIPSANKTTTGFRISMHTAPGAGINTNVVWQVYRYS